MNKIGPHESENDYVAIEPDEFLGEDHITMGDFPKEADAEQEGYELTITDKAFKIFNMVMEENCTAEDLIGVIALNTLSIVDSLTEKGHRHDEIINDIEIEYKKLLKNISNTYRANNYLEKVLSDKPFDVLYSPFNETVVYKEGEIILSILDKKITTNEEVEEAKLEEMLNNIKYAFDKLKDMADIK